MTVREGVNVELIGKTSTLPPDISPIQIGTQGRFGETAFTVLGRVRLRWRLGAWTEWFIEFSDNTTGWLAESQGFFMVSRDRRPESVPRRQELREGKKINFAGVKMTMVDVKNTTVEGCEGELPYVAPPGREGVSADLTGPNSAFASIEYSNEQIRSFFGRYCKFEELSLTNLRPVPGWFGNPPLAHERGVNAVNCPRCGGESAIRAPGSAVTLACSRCGAVLDVTDPNVRIIAEARQRLNIPQLVPLGSRGMLFGIEYEAIGFMARADGPYNWFEYLLFNPHHGYTWLVNYRGHWNFVERLLDFPEETVGGGYAVYEGKKYQLFLRGTASVRYVMGEFYWRIDFGEKAITSDFINPPNVLSRESYPDLHEVTWSRGTYIPSSQLLDAFKLKQKMPDPLGVYLNQPNPWKTGGYFGLTTLLLISLLIFVQMLSVGRARNEQLITQSLTYDRADTNQSTPTFDFEIKDKPQALRIDSSASLDNSWIELAYELRNIKTGDTHQFVEGLEYYHGYDSDGSWSEGSFHKKTILPALEPGKYQLIVDPEGDPQASTATYSFSVRADPPVWRNFWVCLAVLLAYPIFRYWRSSAFEQSRRSESDFITHGFFTFSSEDDDE